LGHAIEWTEQSEVPETTPSGKRWIADVLLEKEGRRVAVEVQWSNQNHVRYLERQQHYAEAGVEVSLMPEYALKRPEQNRDRSSYPVAREAGHSNWH
jgi:hypothetical protein